MRKSHVAFARYRSRLYRSKSTARISYRPRYWFSNFDKLSSIIILLFPISTLATSLIRESKKKKEIN